MDLIYTDVDHNDVGVLKRYTLDLAFGTDENNFELTLDADEHCCQANCLLYIESTEYGGIIDRIGVESSDYKVSYFGRTWQGILASKVIAPSKDEAYLFMTGEANKVIGRLIDRLGLSDIFVASQEDSGMVISSYRFNRYVDGYSGICKMLDTVHGKLRFACKNGQVIVSALSAVDYSKDEQFDSDQVEITAEKTYNTVNHLICLGKGELTERQVIHLYVDPSGTIRKNKSFSGLQEIVSVYDYPNAESLEDLEQQGRERLKSLITGDKMEVNFAPENDAYDIGDIVGGKESITGLCTTARINKKIVTISQGIVNIQYKVGE